MKASEILKQCCGNHYNTLGGKEDVIAMVEKLERDNKILMEALKEIQVLPSYRDDESSGIAFRARKACR